MTKIGIGVIGLGRMGQVYGYHAAHQVESAKLVAVAEPRQVVAETFSSRVGGVTVYADYHDLLNDPAVNAVIITTPTSTHHEIVLAAAAAGKAIFCEKPTSLSLASTDEMIAAVEKAGVIFQVGFMRRFDRACAAAKKRIEEGVIGRPVTIRSIGRDPYRTSLEYADPNISGGLIVDMGIHDFDLIRWLMNDDVDRVYSEAASLVYPELLTVGDVDNAMIVLKFKQGGLGNVEVSRTAIYGYDIQCEIIGSEGTLQVGYLQETPLLVLNKAGVTHDVVPHFPQRFGPAYVAQIEHFIDCLVSGKQPLVTAHDARKALQIGLAAALSQREERVVRVDDVQA
ncbi:MAG: Gfo/Idh/MocA family oxidoreductase [Anaerolineae bacterium]